MRTLYDLLGALPHDDAEDLRAAFRRAVKGAHPDLRPGDPDAALKFREIVRANEILGDPEQRAAYDDLLELARLEQQPGHPIAAKIHRLASGVIAIAGASAAMTIGGYLLFMHMSVASIGKVEAAQRASPAVAAVGPAGTDKADSGPAPSKRESARFPREAKAPDDAMPRIDAENVLLASAGPAPALPLSEARFLRAPAIAAGRDGDPNGAFTRLGPAGLIDPKFLPAYIDRGIIFYRSRKFDHAFAATAPAKRTEKTSRSKPAAAARKQRVEHAATAPSVPPLFRQPTAAQDPSRQESIVLVRAR